MITVWQAKMRRKRNRGYAPLIDLVIAMMWSSMIVIAAAALIIPIVNLYVSGNNTPNIISEQILLARSADQVFSGAVPVEYCIDTGEPLRGEINAGGNVVGIVKDECRHQRARQFITPVAPPTLAQGRNPNAQYLGCWVNEPPLASVADVTTAVAGEAELVINGLPEFLILAIGESAILSFTYTPPEAIISLTAPTEILKDTVSVSHSEGSGTIEIMRTASGMDTMTTIATHEDKTVSAITTIKEPLTTEVGIYGLEDPHWLASATKEEEHVVRFTYSPPDAVVSTYYTRRADATIVASDGVGQITIKYTGSWYMTDINIRGQATSQGDRGENANFGAVLLQVAHKNKKASVDFFVRPIPLFVDITDDVVQQKHASQINYIGGHLYKEGWTLEPIDLDFSILYNVEFRRADFRPSQKAHPLDLQDLQASINVSQTTGNLAFYRENTGQDLYDVPGSYLLTYVSIKDREGFSPVSTYVLTRSIGYDDTDNLWGESSLTANGTKTSSGKFDVSKPLTISWSPPTLKVGDKTGISSLRDGRINALLIRHKKNTSANAIIAGKHGIEYWTGNKWIFDIPTGLNEPNNSNEIILPPGWGSSFDGTHTYWITWDFRYSTYFQSLGYDESRNGVTHSDLLFVEPEGTYGLGYLSNNENIYSEARGNIFSDSKSPFFSSNPDVQIFEIGDRAYRAIKQSYVYSYNNNSFDFFEAYVENPSVARVDVQGQYPYGILNYVRDTIDSPKTSYAAISNQVDNYGGTGKGIKITPLQPGRTRVKLILGGTETVGELDFSFVKDSDSGQGTIIVFDILVKGTPLTETTSVGFKEETFISDHTLTYTEPTTNEFVLEYTGDTTNKPPPRLGTHSSAGIAEVSISGSADTWIATITPIAAGTTTVPITVSGIEIGTYSITVVPSAVPSPSPKTSLITVATPLESVQINDLVNRLRPSTLLANVTPSIQFEVVPLDAVVSVAHSSDYISAWIVRNTTGTQRTLYYRSAAPGPVTITVIASAEGYERNTATIEVFPTNEAKSKPPIWGFFGTKLLQIGGEQKTDLFYVEQNDGENEITVDEIDEFNDITGQIKISRDSTYSDSESIRYEVVFTPPETMGNLTYRHHHVETNKNKFTYFISVEEEAEDNRDVLDGPRTFVASGPLQSSCLTWGPAEETGQKIPAGPLRWEHWKLASDTAIDTFMEPDWYYAGTLNLSCANLETLNMPGCVVSPILDNVTAAQAWLILAKQDTATITRGKSCRDLNKDEEDLNVGNGDVALNVWLTGKNDEDGIDTGCGALYTKYNGPGVDGYAIAQPAQLIIQVCTYNSQCEHEAFDITRDDKQTLTILDEDCDGVGDPINETSWRHNAKNDLWIANSNCLEYTNPQGLRLIVNLRL